MQLKASSQNLTVSASAILALLVLPALKYPEQIRHFLNWLHGITISLFSGMLNWLLALVLLLCIVLALWPKTARLKLGRTDENPEISLFAWLAMLYSSGVSAALLKWSVAEPFQYLSNNPDVIQGVSAAGADDNFRMALKWAFVHWGLSAWACYAVTGLALAFICYRNNMKLGIRSALSLLMGRARAKQLANWINLMAIVVGMLCLLQIISFGLEQTRSNLIWLNGDRTPISFNLSTLVLLALVGIVCVTSITCVTSGIRRGMKWMSILNVSLSAVLLIFLLDASSYNGFVVLVVCIYDYLLNLPSMSSTVWFRDYQPGSVPSALADWQRKWSMFHWTWWIPFSLFVGTFMAKISKGRTVREFVLGAIVVPTVMCFIWMAWAGGTAMSSGPQKLYSCLSAFRF